MSNPGSSNWKRVTSLVLMVIALCECAYLIYAITMYPWQGFSVVELVLSFPIITILVGMFLHARSRYITASLVFIFTVVIAGIALLPFLSSCSFSCGKYAAPVIPMGIVIEPGKQPSLDVSIAPNGHTVKITGPENVIQLSKGSAGMAYAGCLYSIDWGDGMTEPNGSTNAEGLHCTSSLQHAYNMAGNYTISVQTYGEGPSDALVPGWSANASVAVN